MFYHWLITGCGKEPLHYALINEFIKQYFIMMFTKHILVEFILKLILWLEYFDSSSFN